MYTDRHPPGWGFRIAALVVLAGAILFFAVAIVGDAGWSAGDAVHVIGALGFTGILGAGLIAMVLSPHAHAGALQAMAAALAVLLAAAIVGNPDNVGGQAGAFDWAYLIFITPPLLLGSWYLLLRRSGLRVSPHAVLSAIVLAASVPLAVYGIDAALAQRNSFPPASDPHHNGHWITMAQLAFAIPLAGLVAAFRPTGWRLTLWTVSLAAAGLGAGSILWPATASSLGRGWGWLCLLGAGVFAAVGSPAWFKVRQPRAASPGSVSPAG